ncbi:MAG TPA: NADH-quinone oxidoreductase subunit J [Candidatus Kapabacteria bacterium]|nr:NADH-quinone oxidoreductase subunit J [Candidatus Kapabacteria bacterium]
MNEILFWILSAGAIGSAILMVTRKSAVSSALSLVLTFCFLAALYLTLQAQFLAIVQVAVYAGAIMVLVLFVIMLLNLQQEIFSIGSNWKTTLGVLGVGAIAVQIIAIIMISKEKLPQAVSAKAAEFGTVESVGMLLYKSYAFPFEMASLVLIAAAVGAIVLAKKKLS